MSWRRASGRLQGPATGPVDERSDTMALRKISQDDFSCRPFDLIGRRNMLITAQNPQTMAINTMTAGWGGLGFMWGKPCAFVVIRPERYTREFVDAADRFSLCFFDDRFKRTLGYLGTVSGRDEDKIARSGLTCMFEDNVPMFAEAAITMLATKLYSQEMHEGGFVGMEVPIQWYPRKDYHILYVASIDTILEKA